MKQRRKPEVYSNGDHVEWRARNEGSAEAFFVANSLNWVMRGRHSVSNVANQFVSRNQVVDKFWRAIFFQSWEKFKNRPLRRLSIIIHCQSKKGIYYYAIILEFWAKKNIPLHSLTNLVTPRPNLILDRCHFDLPWQNKKLVTWIKGAENSLGAYYVKKECKGLHWKPSLFIKATKQKKRGGRWSPEDKIQKTSSALYQRGRNWDLQNQVVCTCLSSNQTFEMLELFSAMILWRLGTSC